MSTWRTLEHSGLTVDLFEPSDANVSRTVLLLRDEAESLPDVVEHPDVIQRLTEREVMVLAPACGPLWAFDAALPGKDAKDTPRQELLHRVLPVIDAMRPDSDSCLGLLGIGMGGQAALRLAYDYAQRFPVVAAIEPKIDFHLYVRYGHPLLEQIFADEELARQHTAILHVHPLNYPRKHFFCCDPASDWFEGADRLRMKLAASGIPFECDLETTTDGDAEAYVHRQFGTALDFVLRGLDSEKLRVV